MQHEPVPPPSDLLAHAGALRALARGILRDPDAAEDVVQDTWMRALERPPARTERLGGWLAAVARTLAFRRTRGEGRRRAREQRAARAEAPEAPLINDEERRHSLRRLTDAVLALPEPYQAAVLLRFYEDLPPRDVAARLGVPLSTVKSRIARGLALLRADLASAFERDGTTLQRALCFLSGPALPVAPAPDAQASASGPAAAAAGAGMAFMGIKLNLVAGGLAAALAGLAAWQGLGREAGPRAAPSDVEREAVAARPAAALALVGEVEALEHGAAPAQRAPVEHAGAFAFEDATAAARPDAYAYELAGTVLDGFDLPAWGAQVYLAPLGLPLNDAAEVDADGRFRASWEAPAPVLELAYAVRGPDGSLSPTRRMRIASGRTEVAFGLGQGQGPAPKLVQVEGELGVEWTFNAGPALVERMALASSGPLENAPSFAPDAAGHGRFALHPECPVHFGTGMAIGVGGGSLGLGVANRTAVVEFSAVLGEYLSPGTTPPEHGSVAGSVFEVADEPAGGTLVVLGSAPGRADGERTWALDDGSFRIENVLPGTWFLTACGGDLGRATATVVVAAGREERVEARLDRGREAVGRLVDAHGAAVRGAWIELACGSPPWVDAATTDGEGRFRVSNVPRGPLTARVSGHYGRDLPPLLERDRLWPGGELLELVLPLDPPKAAGAYVLVLDDEGNIEVGALVRLWHLDSGMAVTLGPLAGGEEGEGYATDAVLPAGAYELEVVAPRRAPVRRGPLYVEGGERAELGPVRLDERGSLALVDATADERQWPRWTMRLWRLGHGARALVAERTGPPEPFLDLAEGSYELDLAPEAAHPAWADMLARGELPDPRRLAVDVRAGERTFVALDAGNAQGAARAAVLAPADVPPEAAAEDAAEPAPVPEDEGFHGLVIHERRALSAPTSCAACH